MNFLQKAFTDGIIMMSVFLGCLAFFALKLKSKGKATEEDAKERQSHKHKMAKAGLSFAQWLFKR